MKNPFSNKEVEPRYIFSRTWSNEFKMEKEDIQKALKTIDATLSSNLNLSPKQKKILQALKVEYQDFLNSGLNNKYSARISQEEIEDLRRFCDSLFTKNIDFSE